VLLGGIPHMDATRDDAARRFVTLIDELYDRHVNLVCTAAAEPPALYSGERLTGAFERTASRLIEMRSAREHPRLMGQAGAAGKHPGKRENGRFFGQQGQGVAAPEMHGGGHPARPERPLCALCRGRVHGEAHAGSGDSRRCRVRR